MLFGLSIGRGELLSAVIYLIPMILSLTVHEYAHAWSAYRLGDDTAARDGRLTLSPGAHIDIFGTILVPLFNVFFAGGMALIGWAKPVPVRPERFRRTVTMRTGMVLTAVAGPVSNLLLAFLAISLFALLSRVVPGFGLRSGLTGAAARLLEALFLLNIGLFVFNLIPLPPLDGSRLLPRSADGFVAAVSPYSFLLIILLLNFVPVVFVLPVRIIAMLLEAAFRTHIMGVGW